MRIAANIRSHPCLRSSGKEVNNAKTSDGAGTEHRTHGSCMGSAWRVASGVRAPETESPVHGKVTFGRGPSAELELDPIEAAIAGIPSSVPLERASEIHLTDAGGGALQWVLHAPSTNWSLQATLWPGSLHLFVHDAEDDEEQLYRAHATRDQEYSGGSTRWRQSSCPAMPAHSGRCCPVVSRLTFRSATLLSSLAPDPASLRPVPTSLVDIRSWRLPPGPSQAAPHARADRSSHPDPRQPGHGHLRLHATPAFPDYTDRRQPQGPPARPAGGDGARPPGPRGIRRSAGGARRHTRRPIC